jgi:hypothetical protein
MRKWLVIYSDAPELHCEMRQGTRSDREMHGSFTAAAITGQIDGRVVRGMWLLKPGLEQEDVVAVYGRYPAEIHDRVTPATQSFRRGAFRP